MTASTGVTVAPNADRFGGEFEEDPLDSLQEEHASSSAHEQFEVGPGSPSGDTAPYERLLADLPAASLPSPRNVVGKLKSVTVREHYDSQVALPALSDAAGVEDGGFAMTRAHVEEYQLPLPTAGHSQPMPRHRASAFALPDDGAAPAFPVSDEGSDEAQVDDAVDYFGTKLLSGTALDPEDLGIDPTFRGFEFESTFATDDQSDVWKWTHSIPAEVSTEFLTAVDEDKAQGASKEDLRKIMREALAEVMPAPAPQEALTNEGLDHIIGTAIREHMAARDAEAAATPLLAPKSVAKNWSPERISDRARQLSKRRDAVPVYRPKRVRNTRLALLVAVLALVYFVGLGDAIFLSALAFLVWSVVKGVLWLWRKAVDAWTDVADYVNDARWRAKTRARRA